MTSITRVVTRRGLPGVLAIVALGALATVRVLAYGWWAWALACPAEVVALCVTLWACDHWMG